MAEILDRHEPEANAEDAWAVADYNFAIEEPAFAPAPAAAITEKGPSPLVIIPVVVVFIAGVMGFNKAFMDPADWGKVPDNAPLPDYLKPETLNKKAIEPALTKTAKRIIKFAHEHPRLTSTSVNEDTVEMTVQKTSSSYGDRSMGIMRIITERDGKSRRPDPRHTLSAAVAYTESYGGKDELLESIVIAAPGGETSVRPSSDRLSSDKSDSDRSNEWYARKRSVFTGSGDTERFIYSTRAGDDAEFITSNIPELLSDTRYAILP